MITQAVEWSISTEPEELLTGIYEEWAFVVFLHMENYCQGLDPFVVVINREGGISRNEFRTFKEAIEYIDDFVNGKVNLSQK